MSWRLIAAVLVVGGATIAAISGKEDIERPESHQMVTAKIGPLAGMVEL